MTSSTISKAISNLEREVGIEIFHKDKSGVILTEEGREFIPQIQGLIIQMEYISKINKLQNRNKKKFVVSSQQLNGIYSSFRKLYDIYGGNKFEFELKETSREDIVKDVSNGNSDIGVFTISNIEEVLWQSILEKSNLEYEKITEGQLAITLSSKDTLSSKEDITFDDIKKYTNINVDGECESILSYSLELSKCGINEIQMERVVKCRSIILHHILLDKCKSYSIVVQWDKHIINNKDICVKKLKGNELKFYLIYVKNKDRVLSDVAMNFLSELKKELGV